MQIKQGSSMRQLGQIKLRIYLSCQIKSTKQIKATIPSNILCMIRYLYI